MIPDLTKSRDEDIRRQVLKFTEVIAKLSDCHSRGQTVS